MNDDVSFRFEIASARNVIEELRQNGEVSKSVFETLNLGLDALTRQDELAHPPLYVNASPSAEPL